MTEKKERSFRRTYLLMWCGLLLTVPTLVYGFITTFYQRAFNERMIEDGMADRMHSISFISLVLPIAGLLLILYARLIIEHQTSKYDYYKYNNKQLMYNNILVGYFITLSAMAILYLIYS